jgi:hypothetical protein
MAKHAIPIHHALKVCNGLRFKDLRGSWPMVGAPVNVNAFIVPANSASCCHLIGQ